MGNLKERYLHEEESWRINLARALGITWDELVSLDFEVHTNTSKDGVVYGYIVQFAENNDPALLGKVRGLDDANSVHLSPWSLDRIDDEEYELDAITGSGNHKANFKDAIYAIERLQEISIDDQVLRTALLRQLYIGVIGALETYLSDAFINKALNNDNFLKNFVESHPEFRKQKIQLSEIYSASLSIKEKSKNVMLGTIYHKLPIVKEMYEATFDIVFPDISVMQKYITQRHDFIHRNGKTTDGKVLIVSDNKLIELISTAVDFVEKLSYEIDNDIPF